MIMYMFAPGNRRGRGRHTTGTTTPALTSGGWLLAGLLAGAALLATPLAHAAQVMLEEISYSTLPGDRVQLKLSLSGPAPEPTSFTIDNPARIALDLAETGVAMERGSQQIGVGVARSVQAVEAGGRTRVVLNLSRLVPYEVRREGSALYLSLGGATRADRVDRVEWGADSAGETADSAEYTVTDIDFRRGDEGGGRVIVSLSDPSTAVDIRQEGSKVVAEFIATALPERLERRLDVTDFATPVHTIDTYADGGNVRMVIDAKGEYRHLAYQTEKQLTVELQPLTREEQEEQQKDEFGYTGERLSLNFQNIEVRAVLQLLADFTGLNIVTSDTVSGNITLRLKNVPWDQALDIILKARGLGMRQVGNVVMIAPTEEIAAREKQELEAKQQIEELAPLRSDSIQVNYAKASELAALIQSGDSSLLSERGKVAVDERTNRLLLKDTQENLDAIRNLIEELDIPVKQVLIESRVVLATDTFNEELGVRFGVTDVANNDPLGDSSSTVTSGNLNATTQVINGEEVAAPDRFNVDLPVTSMASAASLGLAMVKLPIGTLVELELSAAQAQGQTELLSSPRVITSNQKEATIEQGVEIPYQEATSSGATNVDFKKAVLSLKVTPQITPDDRIIMDLKVNKDNVGEIYAGVPSINTQNVTTQVLVDNGETVVLGGVYEQNKQNQVTRVPFLGELPVVGFLFRNTYEADEKSELLIFVTPKILKETAALRR